MPIHRALQELERPDGREPTRRDILRVIRVEVLVDAPVAYGAADALLEAGNGLDEPLALNGFAKGAVRVLRHPPADAGDLQQFLPALRVRLGGGNLLCEDGVPAREVDDRVAHQNHRVEEGRPFDVVLRVEWVQPGAPRARRVTDALDAEPEDFLVIVVPRQ